MQFVLRTLATIVAVYLAVTLAIVTPMLNVLPGWYVHKTYGRTLTTRQVVLNPLTLSIEIGELALTEPDGERFFALADTSIDLSASSLWRDDIALDALRVHDIYLNIVRGADGKFNFADLLPANRVDAEPSSEPPALTLHQLDILATTLVYTDRQRSPALRTELRDIALAAQNLSTLPASEGTYTLSLTGIEGQLRGQGSVALANRTSSGKLQLTGLSLPALGQIAEPWLQFILAKGSVALSGDYSLAWDKTLAYRVDKGNLAVSGLVLAPRDPAKLPDTGLEVGTLRVAGIAVDGARERVEIAEVDVDSLAIRSWREGTRISVTELFTGPVDPNSPASEPPADPNSPGTPREPSVASEYRGWRATLGTLSVSNSALDWRSQYTDPPTLSVRPIAASAQELNWPPEGTSPFTLTLKINDAASLQLDGKLDLAAGNGSMKVQLGGLPMTWFNPNLPAPLHASITGGVLAVDSDIQLADFTPEHIALSGEITDFSARQRDVEETLTGWRRVRVGGLAVDLREHRAGLEKLEFDGYQGRLHIFKDGSVNASRIWQQEVGDEAAAVKEELAEGKPWKFSLPRVVIRDSKLDFWDQSLPIPFRAVIGDLDGEVTGIDNAPDSSATVDLEGAVDEYAPVTLKGKVSPFAEPLALDLALRFKGVDMALLSPYSGTYAGYRIDGGLLDLDLDYTLQDGRIKGDNQIRMERLKLGEKIESDKAVDLPLKLALAILTDRNGVIDIALPVSGDVDDPEFKIGGILVKAFFSLVTKVVTAPFSLLAGLVDSEEDLQLVTFPAGAPEPDQSGIAKLDQIAQALAERPQLELTITGRFSPEADRGRLQRRALDEQLLADGLSPEELASKGEEWTEAIEERFEQLPPAQGVDPATLNIREKRLQVAASIPVADTALTALAEQRAAATKNYLVTTAGLAADRAVIERTAADDDKNRISGVELGVAN